MYKIAYLAAGLVLLTTIACKKKKTPETPAAYVWAEGTGPYAPYTLGSTFTYETQSTAPVATDSFTYTVTKDTTIDGAKYKKLESNKPALASTFYCNYSNSQRTEITYNGNFGGVAITTLKQVVLKDAVPATTAWVETINVNVPIQPPIVIPVTVSFNYTITQKDFTKTILTKDYTKVIQVKQVASVPASLPLPVGTPNSIQLDNYFASEVGIAQRDLPNSSIKVKRVNVIK